MIAAAIGRGRPLVVAGSAARRLAADRRCSISLGIASSLVVALMIRKAAAAPPRQDAPRFRSGHCCTPGLPAIFLASVEPVTALDLLVIYMPALAPSGRSTPPTSACC
jgi:hypothetical protein